MTDRIDLTRPGKLHLPSRTGYLFESDRECINCMTRSGFYPIHQAVFKLERNDDDFDDEDDNKQLEIVKFLLQSDPECASKAMPP